MWSSVSATRVTPVRRWSGQPWNGSAISWPLGRWIASMCILRIAWRKYAYQVLLLDEFRRAGVEVVFVNHAVDPSPEGELLLQVQGVIAEYERAKILERGRRGRRQAAKRGSVSIFSRAPYGYRYVPKGRGDGEARYEIISEEAAVVRQVYEWFVRDRLASMPSPDA